MDDGGEHENTADRRVGSAPGDKRVHGFPQEKQPPRSASELIPEKYQREYVRRAHTTHEPHREYSVNSLPNPKNRLTNPRYGAPRTSSRLASHRRNTPLYYDVDASGIGDSAAFEDSSAHYAVPDDTMTQHTDVDTSLPLDLADAPRWCSNGKHHDHRSPKIMSRYIYIFLGLLIFTFAICVANLVLTMIVLARL